MRGGTTKTKLLIGLIVLALVHFGIDPSFPESLLLFILVFTLTFVFLPMFLKLPRLTNILILVGATFFLLFCFSTIRGSSFDGLVTYLKTIYLVKSNFSEILILSNPIRPFLIEALLGILWRYSDIRVVGVSIGFAYLMVGYLTLNFLSLLGYSKKVRILAVTILLGSPTFLLLGLYEYKIDLFLLVSCLVTYIVFYRIVAIAPTARALFSFSLLSGVTLLIKFTYLPLFVCLGFCVMYEIAVYQKFRTFKKLLVLSSLIVFGFSPILIWTALFGSQLSYLGYVSKDFEFYRIPKTSLLVNIEAYEQCRAEVIAEDRDQYLPNNNIADVLTQPINYVLNRTAHNGNHQTLFDIGFFLYFSLVAFIPLIIWQFRSYSRTEKYLYMSAAVYIVIFFLTVGSTFWYLLPILPIVAAPLMNYLYGKGVSRLGARILDSLVVTTVLFYFLLASLLTLTANSLSTEMWFMDLHINDFSKAVEQAASTGWVYNNSTFGFDTFNVMQHRVLPNTHFFAGFASVEELHKELISKGVTHISVIPALSSFISDRSCALREAENFARFQEKYLTPVYFYGDRPILWRITNGGEHGVILEIIYPCIQ